jgi:hypothetical protein
MGPLDAQVSLLGDEVLNGIGVLAQFEVVLDHGRRVLVRP